MNKKKVVVGMSGGVDSSVTAVLLQRAIGNHLYCVFVNNGLLRKDEHRKVIERFKKQVLCTPKKYRSSVLTG